MEEINSRLDEAEDGISGLEDKVEKNTQAEQQKEKRNLKNEETLRNIWDNMKHNNIHIMGIPEGEESEQGIENLFEEIMAKNFPNLVKEKRHTSPGRSGSPKQVGPKEAYTETHHN